ncbi:MDIS1-interacting receptor like kinase 2-like [Tripterygium wilfordii]|uniref:MDIS1-interacting receptor like kinase 2-like n=1 Tax=Tripterygium wilfordii TaxID=458696 RepID=UPI0018F8458F|nr:MDIS1-interacting receptor like kinase 2-like [Tripterygium wilfordii]
MAKSSLDKSLSLVLFFSLLVFLHHSLCLATSKSSKEAQALLIWKATLHIINHSNLTSWTFPPSNAAGLAPCTWYGISCEAGSVFKISLQDSGIGGRLHEFPFSSFHSLAYLNLSYNKLNGSIPSQISQLTKLISLDLSNNQLSGTIPADIGLLTHLEVLQLGHNSLAGLITQEIGKLKSLNKLSLQGNNLKGPIPTSLGNLTNMTYLDLSNNWLTDTLHEFPFSSLLNLFYLDLSSNELRGSIPPQISQLTELIYLDLSNNRLSGNIPTEIGLLTHLGVLGLGYNRLNGSIAQEIGKLKSLNRLSLHGNCLEGPIPTSLGNLSNMTYLFLHENLLTSTIHEFPFSSLRNLAYLDISSNKLYGSIPPQISQLTKLIQLASSDNQLSGNIPAEIGLLTHLEVLQLGNNRLRGSINQEIGKLKSLNRLSLYSNNLEGPIPTSLGSLSNMTHLDLSNNLLNGSIPSTFGKLKSLKQMLLNDNRLSGFIPPEFGDLINLKYLSLRNNQLSHEIPITLMKLYYLSLLDLSNNLLIGHIPSSIRGLKNVQNLNLSHNNLSGGIPESFSDMPRLFSFDFSYNKLEGHIPYIETINDVGFEAFRGNGKLCGDIQGLQSCSLDRKYRVTFNKGTKIPFLIILLPLLGALLLVYAVAGIFIIKRKRKINPQAEESIAYNKCLSWISSAFDGRIMYKEIIEATNDFDATYRIGRGGFGTVYKAELPSAGTMAVKKFHSPGDGEHAFQKVFLNEIKALLEIKHRNIVKLHGFCTNARHSFLVYEYLERGSLASFLRREETAKELDWSKRLNIVKGVARALYYLHHDCLPPIVHRDISSNNVLLDSKCEAHVSDFGTAKLLKMDSSNWSKIAGTYGYIAPELAYMMKVTEKCDVYSFGVLSVEVIKGEHPGDIIESLLSIQAEEKMVLKDILDQRLPPPSLAVKYEIKVILELAIQCMHSNPKHRPTMHMVCQQLLARFGFQDPPPQLCLD